MHSDWSIRDVTINDFAELFGVSEEQMPPACKDLIVEKDFRYTSFSQQERDAIILDMLNKIDNNIFSCSGEGATERWDKGWTEILENFKASGFQKEALIPQYNKKDVPIRLYGDYVKTLNYNFENDFIDVLRKFVFYSYLSDKSVIYDFGCGTGLNIFEFALMDKDKEYHGLDWVSAPKDILKLIRHQYGFDITGHIFDMFNPDYDLDVKEGAVLFTCGALEQLGENYHNMLDFIMSKPFSMCIHLNSILEYYDIENNITDYIVYRFETKRNYLNGYFNTLQQMQKEGKINILKMHRIRCGGISGDGYSLTVWGKE